MVTLSEKPWLGHPPRKSHADSRKLVVPHPHARQARDAPGRHIESCGGTDQNLLKVTHIPMDVAPIGSKVENRVTDHLTRSVVGDVAPAGSLVQLDAATGKLGLRYQEVVEAVTRADAHGNHVGMLDEQEQIWNLAGLSLGDQCLLKL